ncbi:hypothetical protein MTBUT4_660011 [Magnetospirillum sp. UT-4]|nr:hypothetical protein MTBUT4_660011 [Magnetospirillum sp. UT-4]
MDKQGSDDARDAALAAGIHAYVTLPLSVRNLAPHIMGAFTAEAAPPPHLQGGGRGKATRLNAILGCEPPLSRALCHQSKACLASHEVCSEALI